MKKSFSNKVIATILLTLSLIATLFVNEVFAEGKINVGDEITNFALPDGITGAKVSYNTDIKGKSKVFILSFMTTTCMACKKEMTLLSSLANEYSADLKVYAISVDFNGEKTVPEYDKAYGFKVARYMLDPDFKVPHLFGFSFTPSLVVATGDGKIVYMKGGFVDDDTDEVSEAVKDALK